MERLDLEGVWRFCERKTAEGWMSYERKSAYPARIRKGRSLYGPIASKLAPTVD